MVYSGGDARHLCGEGHFRPLCARRAIDTSAAPCSQPEAAAAAGCAGRGSRVRRTGQQGRRSQPAGRHRSGNRRRPRSFTLGSHTRHAAPAPHLLLLLPSRNAEITWIFVVATIVAVFVAYGERLPPLRRRGNQACWHPTHAALRTHLHTPHAMRGQGGAVERCCLAVPFS